MSGKKSGKDRPQQSAKSYMLWLVSNREYSAKQLRSRLKLKGYEESAIEDALALLQSYNYQSDERFAEMCVRMESPRMGDRGVKYKLKESGVAPEVSENHLANLTPEAERARNLVQRFEGKPLDDKLRNKIRRYLTYRGFSSSSIKQALAALSDMRTDDDHDEYQEYD